MGRKNPQKPNEAPKFYANAKADGEITLKAIAKEIATGSTTVSDTDVLATLNELTKVLIKHLSNGEIVKFGDFGSFQITITSEGVDDEKKFTAANIKGNKIQFRPGTDLKEMLATVKYEKYKK
ncbi:Integration host factor subunit beta [Capnocytophaga canimorsus Cc5]|uniref:Integration host factor subunit beta n=1 Tax=Capnocytophaga canimorsus (strain 5) TaxID=860228 RepID=F9YVJ5_CAPCC|nr:Integration host factor subunit beta [Capnocytophaga canimorsus Cc5]